MIISPGRRYIFVHVPKTGGTALSLALEARAMKDDILIGDTPKARRRRGRLKSLTPFFMIYHGYEFYEFFAGAWRGTRR